jgi:hypothetical protein
MSIKRNLFYGLGIMLVVFFVRIFALVLSTSLEKDLNPSPPAKPEW